MQMRTYWILRRLISLIPIGLFALGLFVLPYPMPGLVSSVWTQPHQFPRYPHHYPVRLHQDTLCGRYDVYTEPGSAAILDREPWEQIACQQYDPLVFIKIEARQKTAGYVSCVCMPAQVALFLRSLSMHPQPESCPACPAGHVSSIDHPPRNIAIPWSVVLFF